MNAHNCFPPASLPDAEILILGSMPGRVSLEKNQYYAHPRNLFWHFMQLFFAIDVNAPYQERISDLNKNKVALWDVLSQCEREGSLDVNINIQTEQANDIAGFLSQHKGITKICFNGQKSFSSFKKHILKKMPELEQRYELVVLSSTSPANASIPREKKLAQWRNALLSVSG
ncbi:MAG: DNA-deoxyinosine glycosylase [Gammaproteobacteria bacterium]|nr:DNA-deoxyinosine glycosylase [Gammaproteobacteria bacterium]